MFDAEGHKGEEHCPECDSLDTVTYYYAEGFSEIECRSCGYSTELDELAELTRYTGDLRERKQSNSLPPVPIKRLKA